MAAEARRRPRRRSQWRRLRQAVQALTLFGFLALFVVASRHANPPAIVDLPFRLDPLAMLSQAVAGRTDRRIVNHLLGGDLELVWNEADNRVAMTGLATEVFTGEWVEGAGAP